METVLVGEGAIDSVLALGETSGDVCAELLEPNGTSWTPGGLLNFYQRRAA